MQLKGLVQSLTIEIVEHKQNKHCKTSLINVIKDFKHHRRATKHSIILLQEKLLSKYKQSRGFREIYACKAGLWNSLPVQRSFCLSKNRTFSEGGSDTLFLKVLYVVICGRQRGHHQQSENIDQHNLIVQYLLSGVSFRASFSLHATHLIAFIWELKVDFGRFMKGMNGITDAYKNVRIGCSIHTLHETTKINFQFL